MDEAFLVPLALVLSVIVNIVLFLKQGKRARETAENLTDSIDKLTRTIKIADWNLHSENKHVQSGFEGMPGYDLELRRKIDQKQRDKSKICKK